MTDERSDRGDGRDAKGRWTKDTSGNLHGRPRSVPDLDMADVYNFSQYPTEIVIGGEKQLMTRHEVVLLKLFESAMKGRITSIKFLLEKFEQAQMSRDYLQLWLEKWAERIDEDPSSVPMEAMHLIRRVLDSQGRPRSMIRTRRGGKQKRKYVRPNKYNDPR
ncbi:MAG: hypothetical protein IH961_11165 [Chloroflexi bacterium]|nr:hypothetical protein [Chloroflexota bacterium]